LGLQCTGGGFAHTEENKRQHRVRTKPTMTQSGEACSHCAHTELTAGRRKSHNYTNAHPVQASAGEGMAGAALQRTSPATHEWDSVSL
jgi:hypothetical protein